MFFSYWCFNSRCGLSDVDSYGFGYKWTKSKGVTCEFTLDQISEYQILQFMKLVWEDEYFRFQCTWSSNCLKKGKKVEHCDTSH